MVLDRRIRWCCISGALLLTATAFAAACASDGNDGQLRTGDGNDGQDGSTVLTSPSGSPDGGSPQGPAPPPISDNDGGTPDFDAGPDAVKTTYHTLNYTERCKLITNRTQDDETDNHTHSRFNLRGTDLGIPVAHDGRDLYFFFGDTAGARGIWPLGPESLPDAVGYSGTGLDTANADPSTLCSNLKFLLVSGKSDFAGAHMDPPAGRSIGDFIHNPAGPRGKNAFPNLPGDFEVPSGAFSYKGSIYVYYTIINHDPFEMRGSYLAKWESPSTSSTPNYKILYKVDERFDSNGPMRGDFINIAPVVYGDYVYLYGTGQYRKSSVSLARKPLANLETEGGYERYDSKTKAWIPVNQAGDPVIVTPAGGEFSVVYFDEIRKFIALNSELGFVHARFADAPEGPWSEPVSVVNMIDPGFAAKYCCFDITNPTNENAPCVGQQLLHCTKAGLYGSYLLPHVKVNADQSFEITFTVSTWDPYSVALMSATISK